MLLRLLFLTTLAGIFEIWLLVRVAQASSALMVFGLIVLAFFAGLSLLRGLGAQARVQMNGNSFTPPPELGGVLVTVIAAALLMLPGIVSDFVAAFMMLPPVHRELSKRIKFNAPISMAQFGGFGGPFAGGQGPFGGAGFYNAQQHDHASQAYGQEPITDENDWRSEVHSNPSDIILDAEIIDDGRNSSRR